MDSEASFISISFLCCFSFLALSLQLATQVERPENPSNIHFYSFFVV